MRPVCVTWRASQRRGARGHLTMRRREKSRLNCSRAAKNWRHSARKKNFMKIQVSQLIWPRIIKAGECRGGVFYSMLAVGSKQNNNRETRSKLSVLLHGS